MLKPESLGEAFKNVAAVIHTAASTMMYPRRHKSIWKINYQGTRNLAECAAEYKVKRFINIGTANSFGAGSLNNPGTELSPYTDGQFGADYILSHKNKFPRQ